MKYEYTEIYEGEAGHTLLSKINELGKEGWRLVSVIEIDGYRSSAFLERITGK